MNEHRPWWTVQQLAEHYGMSVRTIYAEVETGRLAAHRFGGARGALRIADSDRADWEASSRQHNGGPPHKSFRRSPESERLVEKHLQL